MKSSENETTQELLTVFMTFHIKKYDIMHLTIQNTEGGA